MYRYDKVAIATNGSGAATVYSRGFIGLLYGFVYVPGTLDTGADLTITEEASGVSLLATTNTGTSAIVKLPRAPVVDAANAASLYASGGEPVEDRYPVMSRVKCVVAQGGTSKAGTLYVIWEE
jgi:hypothetical protein